MTDLTKREMATLVPIVLFVVWIGVYPRTFLKVSAPMAKQTVEHMQRANGGTPAPYAQTR